MKETDLRKKIKDYLKDEYGASVHVYHGHAMGELNHPDMYGTLPSGRAYWLELKLPKSKHDKNHLLCQIDWLRRERDKNAVCGMISCVQSVDIVMQNGFYIEKEWLDRAGTAV
jgi:hypothetical protein